MKKILFVILSTIAMNNAKGQTNYINVCQDCDNLLQVFDFNSPYDSSSFYFYFDTLQVNNIWQVGSINKTVFTSGFYNPSALVTDTINPYPISNISSFQFSIINCSSDNVGDCGGSYWGPFFDIRHRFETDSGLDGGTIEVSHNNGINWLNLIQDTINIAHIESGNIYTLSDTVESLGKPGFSGSADWDYIKVYYNPSTTGAFDTITFRFTFASDSIQTGKDGWMIGHITTDAGFESIEEIQNDNLISISPNPTSDELRIHRSNASENQRIQILNYNGQILYDNPNFIGETIDTQQLGNGIYLLKYSDKKYFSIKKFVVQH